MTTIETLNNWLNLPAESEYIDFKEAKNSFPKDKLMKYCVAIANEGGGHLVLGVSDKLPRQVVGTNAYPSTTSLNDIKKAIYDKLHIRIEVTELNHSNKRVLVVEIPPRPTGQALAYEGQYLMRSGESLVPMTPDKLKAIFAEDEQDWFSQVTKSDVTPSDVVALLDTQKYFELLKKPYPTTQDEVLADLERRKLIEASALGWNISNMAAILLAKNLSDFSDKLARKGARFIVYEGSDKAKTLRDFVGPRGYAVCFEDLVNHVYDSAPQNVFVEQAIRDEQKMFPLQALRELIANALVHQDFQSQGISVMIEMYDDRVEISNPGTPPIKVDRFIDEHQSRNEQLANLMRRFGICEEKGSGVDKVVMAAEVYQLPAPNFQAGHTRTVAVLFAHQDFEVMSKNDRIRACYQHCCLQFVSNKRMSNQSLRERFKLEDGQTAIASQIITATKEVGLIKSDDSRSASTRYARYVPYWA